MAFSPASAPSGSGSSQVDFSRARFIWPLVTILLLGLVIWLGWSRAQLQEEVLRATSSSGSELGQCQSARETAERRVGQLEQDLERSRQAVVQAQQNESACLLERATEN